MEDASNLLHVAASAFLSANSTLVGGAQAAKRSAAITIIQRMMHIRLAAAFEAWIDWTVAQQDLRQRAMHLIKRWRALNLAAALSAFQRNREHRQMKRQVCICRAWIYPTLLPRTEPWTPIDHVCSSRRITTTLP